MLSPALFPLGRGPRRARGVRSGLDPSRGRGGVGAGIFYLRCRGGGRRGGLGSCRSRGIGFGELFLFLLFLTLLLRRGGLGLGRRRGIRGLGCGKGRCWTFGWRRRLLLRR